MWDTIAELGWLGMTILEEHGGAGLSLIELAIVLEEMGASATPGPFFSTAVVGARAIDGHGSADQKSRYLPALAEGKLKTSLAVLEQAGAWDTRDCNATAERAEDGWVVSGRKMFVADAANADLLIVAARTGESDRDISLFLVDKSATADIEINPISTVSDDRNAEVAFNDVKVSPDALLGDANAGWEIVEDLLGYGAVAKAAEMLGGARFVVDMTVEFAKERVQFGRPIGTFQAVQHKAAEIATDLEVSRQFVYNAAWKLSNGRDADADVAVAKYWLSDKFPAICSQAHQLHGAIGFTKEHDLQIFSRRAMAASVAFGDANQHRETIARSMGL
jgi:alkylation response protein AidB-like acyl-CoA dehydrogenase